MICTFAGIRDIHPSEADRLPAIVRGLLADGVTELRFGGARGLDTLALEAAATVGFTHRIVYVPFAVGDQPLPAQLAIKLYATRVVELHQARTKRAYYTRNETMIYGAARVEAFTDGRTTGGTWGAIQFARKQGIAVNVHEVRAL